MLVSVITATIGLAMLVRGVGKIVQGSGRILPILAILGGVAALLVPTANPIAGLAVAALIVAVACSLPTLGSAGAARSAAVSNDQLLYLRAAAMRC